LILVDQSTGSAVTTVSSFTGDSAGGVYSNATATLPLYGADSGGPFELRLQCSPGHISKTQQLAIAAVHPLTTTTLTPNKTSLLATENLVVTLNDAPLYYPNMKVDLVPADATYPTITQTVTADSTATGNGSTTASVDLRGVPFGRISTYDLRLSCLKDQMH